MKQNAKRITSLLLVIVIILGMAGQVTAANHPFTDVPSGSYYAKAVEWAYGNSIVNGITATQFGPNTNMTRAMMVTMLYRAAGKPPVTGTNKFTDVPAGTYYTTPVVWAANNNIVTGTSATTFAPEANITRQDIVVILYRYEDSPKVSGTLGFADASDVSGYAGNAVIWASQNGIVTGKSGNRFDPKGLATRAEVTTILYRYFSNKKTEETPPDGHAHDFSVPNVIREATCVDEGEVEYSCAICGKVDEKHSITPATGIHTYKLIDHVDATCGTDGKDVYKCKFCDDRYEDPIPATGKHNGETVVSHKDATCTEDGYTVKKCDTCGQTYEKIIPCTGHEWETATWRHIKTYHGYVLSSYDNANKPVSEGKTPDDFFVNRKWLSSFLQYDGWYIGYNQIDLSLLARAIDKGRIGNVLEMYESHPDFYEAVHEDYERRDIENALIANTGDFEVKLTPNGNYDWSAVKWNWAYSEEKPDDSDNNVVTKDGYNFIVLNNSAVFGIDVGLIRSIEGELPNTHRHIMNGSDTIDPVILGERTVKTCIHCGAES